MDMSKDGHHKDDKHHDMHHDRKDGHHDDGEKDMDGNKQGKMDGTHGMDGKMPPVYC